MTLMTLNLTLTDPHDPNNMTPIKNYEIEKLKIKHLPPGIYSLSTYL